VVDSIRAFRYCCPRSQLVVTRSIQSLLAPDLEAQTLPRSLNKSDDPERELEFSNIVVQLIHREFHTLPISFLLRQHPTCKNKIGWVHTTTTSNVNDEPCQLQSQGTESSQRHHLNLLILKRPSLAVSSHGSIILFAAWIALAD
jgi:hypothetical protein